MRKTDRILALDIGASTVKLAEFSPVRGAGVKLENYGVVSLGLDAHSDTDRSSYITASIKEIMREKGISSGRVLVSVSGQSVFQRFVKLPPVNKDKVLQIVQYEAQQNVPFPINEVVWDYQLIGSELGDLDVMIAAIKAEIIEDMADAVEAAGLETDLVDVAPLALYNAVRFNYSDLSTCTLIVDMGARSTDLIFIDGNRFFCRSIPVAGNAITQQIMQEFDMSFEDAEELKCAHAFVAFGGVYEGPKGEVSNKVSKIVRGVMTRMHAEINRSISFYRGQQSGNPPKRVLLTGGTAVIPHTDTFLKDKMKVVVEYLNPFLNAPVSRRISTELIAKHAYVLGEVVGLALRSVLDCPIEINLLPQKVVETKEFKRKQPFLIAAAIALVLVLAVWCGYFTRMKALSEERLEKTKDKVQAMLATERKLIAAEQGIAEMQGSLSKLYDVVEGRGYLSRMLAEIHGALPEGMWVTAIEPARPAASQRSRRSRNEPEPTEEDAEVGIRQVEITGLAHLDHVTVDNPIRAFRDALRESDYFTEESEISRQPALHSEIIREFQITLVLAEPIK